MNSVITEKLYEIEKQQNVKILFACESGSRAWGFASPDSDYDVRFIYVRNKNDYLRLDDVRDVIELPINDLLDINGWDLNKTLRLLYKSNPTLFEWFSSPIIYKKTPFYDRFLPIMNEYFVSQKGLYHYLSMAKGNYREYLRKDMVKAKKYFYVLRPVLACKWILDRQTPPPMLFSDLMAAQLDDALKPDVNRLLDIKMNAPELKEIPKINRINDYIEQSFDEITQRLESIPAQPAKSWDRLNELFLSEIENT